jgi:hypothetical protein
VSAAGQYHTCALETDGTVVCWGRDAEGESTVPAELAPAAQVSAGGYHTCALKADATVLCWGLNTDGQTTVPAGLAPVAQVSAGEYHTCALETDGTVVCWGLNTDGQTTVPAPTTTILSSTPDPSFFGQAVTLTATVTKTSDASAVTMGTVSFIERGTCASPGTTLASGAALNSSGQATFSTSALAFGSHALTACYSGAIGFDQSSGSDTQTVKAATTATVVSATPSTPQYSDKMTLSATITPLTINNSTVTGTVQFQIDGVNAGASQTLSQGGTATLAGYTLTQGSSSHQVTAVFSSTNANFAGSSSAGVTLTVTKEDASLSAAQQPAAKGDVILVFSVSETTPDVPAGTAAAGDISLAGLSVTLVPVGNGSAINLACGAGSVSGTGYAGVNRFTCSGSGIVPKKYQVNGSVTGLYFTGVYSGVIQGSK